jgi:mRNA-degrading endonuclease RelE of RelBE toxin-antitoxin system
VIHRKSSPIVVRRKATSDEDLRHFSVFEQRAIVVAIRVHLVTDANRETKRRKKLTGHPIAPWELRLGKHRVFFEFEGETTVKIVAVGHKEHNDLFIRGRKVEL